MLQQEDLVCAQNRVSKEGVVAKGMGTERGLILTGSKLGAYGVGSGFSSE